MQRVLVTWSDRGVDGPAPAHHGRRPASDRGPVLRLLDETSRRDAYHRAIVLAIPAGLARANALADVMRTQVGAVDVRAIDLDDPSDYAALFARLSPLAGELDALAEHARVDVLLSSGTPQAQTLWVILVQARMLRARMLQVIPPAFVPVPHPRAVRTVSLDIEGFPEIRQLREEVTRLRAEVRARGAKLITGSEPMRELVDRAMRVARSELPVLVHGETGTGKELVARAIHDRSPQRAGPFVSVNLGALPRELAASELFGAVRGAYTGAARDRDGLFRTAHGGTLFLDEMGEASPDVQAMLLRVLETGELYPVGADRPVTVQVRLIAATDADLEDQIRAGQFKAPLLHRLAGYEIQVPALRERRDDIGALFVHFARDELQAIGESHRLSPADPYAAPWMPARLAAQLVRHPWPGNLRQLKNIARRLVIESRGLPQLRIDPRLAAELAVNGPAAAQVPLGSRPAIDLASLPRRKPSDVTEAELLEALRACAWDLKATADRLQIQRPSIYHLIERHPGIRTAGDLGAEEITRCFRDCDGDVDAMVARLQVSKRALIRRIRELGLVGRDDGSS